MVVHLEASSAPAQGRLEVGRFSNLGAEAELVGFTHGKINLNKLARMLLNCNLKDAKN